MTTAKGLSGGRNYRAAKGCSLRCRKIHQSLGNERGLLCANHGEGILRGKAGERFVSALAGRMWSSKASAIMAAEYKATGGVAVILGPTCRNFGLRECLVGGLCLVSDRDFADKCNLEM